MCMILIKLKDQIRENFKSNARMRLSSALPIVHVGKNYKLLKVGVARTCVVKYHLHTKCCSLTAKVATTN